MRLLLIEDDLDTSDYVSKQMSLLGHKVDCLADGREGLLKALDGPYDVIIIDRMLPGLDGLSMVRALRASEVQTPVLFLTSLGGINDRVDGLEVGGDDYLTKPFAFSELLARVNALARRPPIKAEPTLLKIGDLEMDLIRRTVKRGDKGIDLLPREFLLLEMLMRNVDRIVTRTMLLERVWNIHFDPRTSVVETHISRLRAKVDRPFESDLILTVKGIGYIMQADSR